MCHLSASCVTCPPHVSLVRLMCHLSASCVTFLPHVSLVCLMCHLSASCITFLPHVSLVSLCVTCSHYVSLIHIVTCPHLGHFTLIMFHSSTLSLVHIKSVTSPRYMCQLSTLNVSLVHVKCVTCYKKTFPYYVFNTYVCVTCPDRVSLVLIIPQMSTSCHLSTSSVTMCQWSIIKS